MKRTTLLLPVLLFFYVLLPGMASATAKPDVKQPVPLGIPYSLEYLAQQRKLHHLNPPLNAVLSTSTVYFQVPVNTGYVYWIITFSNSDNTYEFNTDYYPGSIPADHYFRFGEIAAGTYTVTLHNISYGGSTLFDATATYNDENGVSQSALVQDVNTDNEDIVFQNVVANGQPQSSMDIWVGPH